MHHLSSSHHSRGRWLGLGLSGLGLYVLLPQTGTFSSSLQQLQRVQVIPVLGAVFAIGITFFLAAATYHFLARQPLLFRRTVLVAVANMFTNRLLPAGTGSIATFFMYLRRRRHSISQATSVIAVNNFLGFLSHACLLTLLFVVDPNSFRGLRLPSFRPVVFIGILVGIVAIVLIVGSKKAWRRRSSRIARSLGRDLTFYRRYPLRLSGAFATSLALTIANAATLWFCCHAVQVAIGPVAALTVFTIGMVAGTITPTPGGLGGAEAGLLAGLVAYRVGSGQALAAVLLYRLLSYWLTLLVGAVTYIYVDRRGYLRPRPAQIT